MKYVSKKNFILIAAICLAIFWDGWQKHRQMIKIADSASIVFEADFNSVPIGSDQSVIDRLFLDAKKNCVLDCVLHMDYVKSSIIEIETTQLKERGAASFKIDVVTLEIDNTAESEILDEIKTIMDAEFSSVARHLQQEEPFYIVIRNTDNKILLKTSSQTGSEL